MPVGQDGCLAAFGATEANRAYAVEYFTYLLPGIPFYMFGTAMNSVIRADGSPAFAMLSALAGCVMNVVLDPIAIFALQMGMKRRPALAAISGQIVTALLAIWYQPAVLLQM
ncbi:MAG: MATE family efflux transporter [Dysosmobacter sp.]